MSMPSWMRKATGLEPQMQPIPETQSPIPTRNETPARPDVTPIADTPPSPQTDQPMSKSEPANLIMPTADNRLRSDADPVIPNEGKADRKAKFGKRKANH